MQLYFDQLTGKSETKPFECVGTIDEVQMALILTKHRFYGNAEIPFLLKNIEVTQGGIQQAEQMLKQIESEHFLGKSFLEIIQQKVNI